MSVSPTKDPDELPQLVGDFQPVDMWQTHINRLFYGLRGSRVREYYQTVAAADYRLGFALAEDYWGRCGKRAKGQAGDHMTRTLTIMEWGAGNGNLAACFLDRLQELDQGAIDRSENQISLHRARAGFAGAGQNQPGSGQTS